MINIGLEQQQRIQGADGTLLWSGAQILANTFIGINGILSTAAAIKMGDAVQYDPTGTGTSAGVDTTPNQIPRSETTAAGATPAADLPMTMDLRFRISPAAINSVNLLGVAQEPIGPLKRGLIAADGSIVSVKCVVAALAVGAFVGSSATAGAVGAQAVAIGNNVVLGAVLKANLADVFHPNYGTGSTSWAGIHIKGGSASV